MKSKLQLALFAACVAALSVPVTLFAANVITYDSHGIHIGSRTTDKIGFYNATAVVQPSGSTQAAIGSLTQDSLTDNSGGSASTTLAALTALSTSGGNTYTDTAVNAKLTVIANAIASFAAENEKIKADIASHKALVNKLRSDLVSLGLIKGSS